MMRSSLTRLALLAAVLAAGVADKKVATDAKEVSHELGATSKDHGEGQQEPAKHHSKEHSSEPHHSHEQSSADLSTQRHEEQAEQGEKRSNATTHGDGCECECSWVSKDKKVDMCATDGDHSCCWHVCCRGFGGLTVTSTHTTSTATATRTSTRTVTVTTTATETSTRTETTTKTSTQTSTSTDTTTSSNTLTGTRTSTTATSTTTTTITTTDYCFEEAIFWDPLDMSGELPSIEVDAFACQRRCLRTDGCFHFSFHEMTSMCHLQDAFAVQRTFQSGYVSGPFQCGSYIKADMFTKVLNNSYLPKEFRCMQPGISYSPDIAAPTHIQGDRSYVVKTCQQQCANMEGCHYFTVHFPGMCRLSGADATPLPGMASVMSGPAESNCDEDTTFMMKSSLLRQGQKQIASEHHSAAATAAALLGAMAMSVAVARRRSQAAWSLREADLEESLAGATSPSSSPSSAAE